MEQQTQQAVEPIGHIEKWGSAHFLVDENSNRIEFLDNRWYKCADGSMVPSVTTLLEAWPKGPQYFEWLKKHGADSDEIRDEAGRRGSTVHNLTELLDTGAEVRACTPEGKPLYKQVEWAMLERYVDFRNTTAPRILEIERNFASPALGYAGTLDRVLQIGDDLWIVDLKTSTMVHDHHHLQTAAYLELYAEATKMDQQTWRSIRRGVLHLAAKTKTYGKKDTIQGPGWQLVEAHNTHEEDLELFSACRRLWHATNKNAKPRNLGYQLSHKL